ncbi:MAG: ATP-binding cassette domain-containing protein [Saprospiraceae bacterium]|nr:ATP-binding cassette domain-containing protein [Saprospiraceae bacterium]
MPILSVREVTKKYHDHLAVDSVSFDMPKGIMLGLLGPNGAGKTSLIRIITTITKADSGSIYFDGEKLGRSHPAMIGYLPEERGLYKKMKVGDQLLYLAQLKGLARAEAQKLIREWMDRFGMTDWWSKRIDELSKGMQQKVQFVSTVVHKPKLIILDEPFSGLDPINTNLLKDEIRRLNEAGTSVIFSTHRMEQVEEICNHIVLINQGKNILEGEVGAIKASHKDHLFRINFEGSLPSIENGIDVHSLDQNQIIIQVNELQEANQFVRHLLEQGTTITSFQEILPTLNEIFIKTVTD